MLRQVQSDRSNLAHGWLPFAADSITAVWHSGAARGPSTPSFNHLVGGGEQPGEDLEFEGSCGLDIDDQLELGRPVDRQVRRLRAFEDATGIESGAAICVSGVVPIADHAASHREVAGASDHRNVVSSRQHRELTGASGKTGSDPTITALALCCTSVSNAASISPAVLALSISSCSPGMWAAASR